MLEGQRNAGPHLFNDRSGVFDKQKGKNLVMYVDDIVVKSDKKETHIQDLQEIFENLRKASLRLNPDKSIFGIKKGKLLGCRVPTRGIEENPKK